MDNRKELLEDMAITGPDGKLLKGIYMSGRISSVTKNYVGIDLPAAEATLRFPKEKCVVLENDHKVSEMFVLFDKDIKKVSGLRMTGDIRPTDHYDEENEAREIVSKITNKRTVQRKRQSETSSVNAMPPVVEQTVQTQPPNSQTVPQTSTHKTLPTPTPSDTSTPTFQNISTLANSNSTMSSIESAVSACTPVPAPNTSTRTQPSNHTPTSSTHRNHHLDCKHRIIVGINADVKAQ